MPNRPTNANAPTQLHIREATPQDCALILRFIRELARYEKAEQAVQASQEQLQRTLFCAQPAVFALILQAGDEPIGFAIYFFNYSTWQGRHGLYLEDLYITPEGRGLGGGKALLQHLARIAVERDCGRFEWSVLDWNTPAIEFYERLDAQPQREWLRYRLSGAALQALADEQA
ncbi:GNAT family N-acetyltransferase [Comamonadaceae bacterium OH2310_COT-174]|nr:GNAT family N-acetyltransferase [Comamonadaceae bacterium OH2310_COT-174]